MEENHNKKKTNRKLRKEMNQEVNHSSKECKKKSGNMGGSLCLRNSKGKSKWQGELGKPFVIFGFLFNAEYIYCENNGNIRVIKI